MGDWPVKTAKQCLRIVVVAILSLLSVVWNAAALQNTNVELAEDRQPIVRPARSIDQHQKNSTFVVERQLAAHVANARQVLMELRAFVDEAAQTVELGEKLKTSRLQNDRLRRRLQAIQDGNNAHEDDWRPKETIVASLTRTVIDNWLQTVRLKHRSAEADLNLAASETAWQQLNNRLATLKKTLQARRAELRALRAVSDTLSAELMHTRSRVVQMRTETLHIQREQGAIATSTEKLRRDVTSKLRSMLLNNPR